MNWNFTRFRGFTQTIHKRVSKGIKRVCRILSNNITTLVYVQHQSLIWHSAWPHFLATLHRSAVGWEAARLLLPLSHQITMFSKNLSSSSQVYFFFWGRLLEDVEDMFKSPKLQQNPMHHCLQGVYLDRRRIERILLSHTEPMIFDISCSLARPCQVFFDWRLQWFGVLGRASHANPMASAQSFNGWIWTTSMSGLLDCWNPAMTIGFDPNFTRKRQLTQKKRCGFQSSSELLFVTGLKNKFHLQFTTQDWIEIHHTRTIWATLSPI